MSDAWFPGNTGNGDAAERYTGRYDGIDFHPLEVVFFKANRGVSEDVLARYSEWLGGGSGMRGK